MEQVNRRRENRPTRGASPLTLDQDDVTKLLHGSQLGSHLRRQVREPSDDGDSSSDDNSDIGNGYDSDTDSDYIANDSDVDDIYFDSDESSDLDEELEDIIADATELQPADCAMTFLEDLLQRLRRNKSGRINWIVLDVDDLVNDYL